jgi:hypothetical protein
VPRTGNDGLLEKDHGLLNPDKRESAGANALPPQHAGANQRKVKLSSAPGKIMGGRAFTDFPATFTE